MKYGTLTRTSTNDEGTFGQFRVYADEFKEHLLFSCVCIEPPWRWNKPEISCVPAQRVLFRLRLDSPKHGKVYEEWDDPATQKREDVAGRPYIQIHSLNLAGDVSRGFVRQSDGCIGLGGAVVMFYGGTLPAGPKDQRGITNSVEAIRSFMEAMAGDTLALDIIWALGAMPPMTA
jgi:hypothetical protein